MTKYKIEKGIPAPRSNGKYPWLEMEVGDSFFVAVSPRRMASMRSVAHGACCRYKPKRWVTRAVEGGIRIWRTA